MIVHGVFSRSSFFIRDVSQLAGGQRSLPDLRDLVSDRSKGNGHEKPWPYWLELILRYEWPVLVGLFLCLACQFFRNFVIRYLAIYGVGVFAAYSIIHYKTPWIIISIVWPLLFVFAAGAAAKKIPRKAFYAVVLR